MPASELDALLDRAPLSVGDQARLRELWDHPDQATRQDLRFGYRMSAYWRGFRKAVFERVGGQCEDCNRRPAAELHHLTYDRLGAERVADVAALCKPCHKSADLQDSLIVRKKVIASRRAKGLAAWKELAAEELRSAIDFYRRMNAR